MQEFNYVVFVCYNGANMREHRSVAHNCVRDMIEDVSSFSTVKLACYPPCNGSPKDSAGQDNPTASTLQLIEKSAHNSFFTRDWACDATVTCSDASSVGLQQMQPTNLWSAVLAGCVHMLNHQKLAIDRSFSLVIVSNGDDRTGETAVVGGGDERASMALVRQFIEGNKLDIAIHFLCFGDVDAAAGERFQEIANLTHGEWAFIRHDLALSLPDADCSEADAAILENFRATIISKQPPKLLRVDYLYTGEGLIEIEWDCHPAVANVVTAFVIERCDAPDDFNPDITPNATENEPSTLHAYHDVARVPACCRKTFVRPEKGSASYWYRVRAEIGWDAGVCTRSSKALLVHIGLTSRSQLLAFGQIANMLNHSVSCLAEKISDVAQKSQHSAHSFAPLHRTPHGDSRRRAATPF